MENREKNFFKCLNIECKKKLIIEKLCRVEKICGGGQILYQVQKIGGVGGLFYTLFGSFRGWFCLFLDLFFSLNK
jgi:hypothetical protein